MNSNPFVYYRPNSQIEISALIKELNIKGTSYAFYAGGTELIPQFRKGRGLVEAIIDIKDIKPLRQVEKFEDKLIMGSAVPLNHVIDNLSVAPFKKALKGIADHTVRNALTIGGNICGRLPYREAVLPLLCRNAKVSILEEGRLNQYALVSLFDKRLKIKENALLWSIEVDTLSVPFELSQRHTTTTSIDYPIIHHYAVLYKNTLNIALSGFANYPVFERFELSEYEASGAKLDLLIKPFEGMAKTDERGSAEYRLALLKVCTENVIKALKETGGSDDKI